MWKLTSFPQRKEVVLLCFTSHSVLYILIPWVILSASINTKNPPQFLKKRPPQNVLFRRQNSVTFQVILCFSQSEENTSNSRIVMIIKQPPTVFYSTLFKNQARPPWDGTSVLLHLGKEMTELEHGTKCKWHFSGTFRRDKRRLSRHVQTSFWI